MKSLISRGLIALGVLGLSTLSLSADENKNSIKGGVGIGVIRIGVDITEVEKLFGKVSDIVNFGPGARVWFVKSANGRDGEIVVTIRRAEDGQHYKVRAVAVTSPDFRTPAGNSTASDLAALWKEFPDLSKYETEQLQDGTSMDLYSSKTAGIGIFVERSADASASDKPVAGPPSGKCRGITVQAIGEDADFVDLGAPSAKKDAD